MSSNVLAAIQPATALIPSPSLGTDSLWISTADFADIAGIDARNGYRAAVRCLNNGTWRGTALQVRTIEGAGGKGGNALQVYIPSLPDVLRTIWHKHNPGALEAPAAVPLQRPAPAIIDLNIGARVAEIKWKLAIAAPALFHKKGSKARAAVLEDIASRQHSGLNGKPVSITPDTLREWLAKIESDNESALARPRRADAGRKRFYVNRKWDKECPLHDSEKRPIAAAIELHIRGLWREAIKSEGKIDALASAELQRLSRAAGWHNAPLIRPGLHLVRSFKASRLVGIKEKDAKLYHDKFRPSIHRRRPDWPMEIVYGDVHPDDVLVTREDGSTGTARVIAWLDMATNELFYTLVLLPKGKGITQAHIIASFIEMVQVWGLPRTLYLDNGSEYLNKDMIAGFNALQGLCEGFQVEFIDAAGIADAASIDEGASPGKESQRAIVRARPYNAQAKPIEGVFSCLSKFTALIPGYIGGDRMKKKTHNVGKVPLPFPGTFEQYRDEAFAEAVKFYHNEPQGGTMGGKSPNERKSAAIAAGWKPPASASRESLLVAFAKAVRCRVHTGGIKVDKDWFRHDEIIPEVGNWIEVHYAKWADTVALWVKPDGTPVLLQKDTLYHPLDNTGAKEQSRRNGLLTRAVADLRAISPRVDMVAAMANLNAALPPPPVTPAGPQIQLSPQTRALVDALHDNADTTVAPPAELPRLSYRDNKTGEIVRPADLIPEPQPARFDIYAAPPPQKTKPDASADAPGFNIYEELAKTPAP
ncbi:MAG: hypothetical protein WC681_12720 [Sterolibacterium sp.]|jgi:hypothetical protein